MRPQAAVMRTEENVCLVTLVSHSKVFKPSLAVQSEISASRQESCALLAKESHDGSLANLQKR